MEFRCFSDFQYIHKSWKCDGDKDCSDNSDETNCTSPTPARTTFSSNPKCNNGQFRCWNDSRCIDKSWQCDNYADCADGSDEFYCYSSTITANATNTFNITVACTDDQFRCWNDSRCIYRSWQCDSYADCADGSDEYYCYNSTALYNTTAAVNISITCTDNQFRCWNGSGCIYKSWQCDNYSDCADGSDEFYCYNLTMVTNKTVAKNNSARVCKDNQFQCLNNSGCFFKSWRCDNYLDCADGSDELNCDNSMTITNKPTVANTFLVTCSEDQFRCWNGSGCIFKSWQCDNYTDCADGSDEYLCGSFNIATSSAASTTTAIKRDCAVDDFRCQDNSRCIPKRWVCDWDNDCPDGSDENDC